MAYFKMPKIGEPVTCDGPCEHTDCKATREMANTPCQICGEIIAAGRACTFNKKGKPEHMSCLLEQIEREKSCPAPPQN
jgi:hypothetical protein